MKFNAIKMRGLSVYYTSITVIHILSNITWELRARYPVQFSLDRFQNAISVFLPESCILSYVNITCYFIYAKIRHDYVYIYCVLYCVCSYSGTPCHSHYLQCGFPDLQVRSQCFPQSVLGLVFQLHLLLHFPGSLCANHIAIIFTKLSSLCSLLIFALKISSFPTFMDENKLKCHLLQKAFSYLTPRVHQRCYCCDY